MWSETEATWLAPDAAVLVAVVTRPVDLERARNEGWYRVPLARAPKQLAADALAFYLTGAFGPERHAVRVIAPVLGVSIARRDALIPAEAAHPRAAERYYRFAIGPLQPLAVPVPAQRLRRVTFIMTSYAALLRADDLTDLWHAAELGGDGSAIWGAGIGRR